MEREKKLKLAHCPRRVCLVSIFTFKCSALRLLYLFTQGKLEVSSVTGRLEPREAPAWQRLAFRYLVSFPIIGLCLALVFAVMFAMLQLQVKKEFKKAIN